MISKEKKNTLHIASCSFGKDSLATILLALEHGEPLDEAVYCEVMFDKRTSGEVPEHRAFIYETALPRLERLGIPVRVLRSDKTYLDLFAGTVTRGPKKGLRRGFPLCGHCYVQRDCKLRPIRRYNRTLTPDTVQYGDGENPVVLKSEFLLSLCEQLIGAGKLSAKEKSVIDRCTAQVYRDYIRSGYHGAVPTLQDFHAELLRQPEKEAQDVALAIELFTDGSLNTFAKPTNVDTNARILCYDIRDLGKQLLPVGMLVVLDSIFNRIIRNRGLKRNTWIYIDEIYLLFQHEYSANFLFTLWKRMRKYQACGTGISQNIEDLLQSHTARTMLANSEFLIMLNQAATDREELAHLLKISDNQLSYITNVDSGRGLIKCGSAIVPFVDHFPKNKLYQMMTTKPSDLAS